MQLLHLQEAVSCPQCKDVQYERHQNLPVSLLFQRQNRAKHRQGRVQTMTTTSFARGKSSSHLGYDLGVGSAGYVCGWLTQRLRSY